MSFPVPHILVIDNLVNDDQGIVYIIYFTSPFSNPMPFLVYCIKYRIGWEIQHSVDIVTNTQTCKLHISLRIDKDVDGSDIFMLRKPG